MKKGKLGRDVGARRALFRGLVTSLFLNKRIVTTEAKAKEIRPIAERYITWAKKGDLHHRRLAAEFIATPEALKVLFDEIGPAFAERPGGYTRIYKLGARRGDATDMAIIELVGLGGPKEAKKDEANEKNAKKTRASKKETEAKETEKAEADEAPKKRVSTKKKATEAEVSQEENAQ